MPLLDRNGWKADVYVRSDGAPGAPAMIVPIEALDATRQARPSGQRLGVEIPNDFHPRALLPVQGEIDLVAVAFPAFHDGRGFSLARMLREQGFEGTLRAAGELLPDLFAFALRCGFDEIEISPERAARQPVEQWLQAAGRIGLGYQANRDSTVSILARRRAARVAA